MNLVNKTVNLSLVGDEDIMTYFQKQAKKEGWTPQEIKTVVDEANKGDYDHMMSTFMNHSNVEEFEELQDEDLEFDDDDGY